MTIRQLLSRNALNWPDRDAIIFESEHITFSALEARTNQLSNAMMGIGAVGDRVGILAQNCPQYVEALYGVPAAGRTLVLLNYRLNPREWAWILDNAKARTIIVEAQYLASIIEVLSDAPSVEHILVIGDPGSSGAISLSELCANASAEPPQVEIDEFDPAVIIFTSGTTGFPKGAMISHRALYMAVVHNAMEQGVIAGERALMAFPMCHAAGFSVPVSHARAGTVVLMRAFDAEPFLALVEQHRIERSMLAPTMAAFVLASPAIDRYDTSSLHCIGYGGMPMPIATARGMAARFGDLTTNFGQSESTLTVTTLDAADHRRALSGDDHLLMSCGRPIGGAAVVVMDEDLRQLPPGEVGELCIRCEFTMSGYWANPEATAAAFAGGWLHTGDLAYQDEEGYLYIVGRMKDMIISGGQNIYATEIERVVATVPGVAEVAVVGTPDPVWGESVVAFVVRSGNATVTEGDIVTRCQDQLASYKKPKTVLFVDALPKNVLGKILKRELRDQLAITSPGGNDAIA